MRRFLLLALVVSLWTGGSVKSGPLFPYPYQVESLPNGLSVILVPMESPGLVAYYSVVRTGSRDEVEPGKSGFAHFFEHMMFRGTKKYPGPVYDSIMTSIGASHNAFTSDDLTAYHVNFAKEDLEQVIDLESDRFQNLHYEKPAFQTEAGAVYGEYRKSVTSPFEVLSEKMQDLAYDVHTYKHTTIGFEADIKKMPEGYDYSLTFFQRFYRPENVVLLITGDIDQQKTMEMIKKYYGPWKGGYKPPAIPPEPPQTAERKGEISYPGKTLPIIDIGYKGDAFDPSNTSFVAAMLLNELAFGETSELYKKLYIKEQKVEFIGGSVPLNRDQPLFEITAMVKKEEDVPYIREEIYKAIAAAQAAPPSEERLRNLKRRQKYSFLMNLDTPNKVAGGMARFIALSGGISVVDRLYSALDAITPQDLVAAAKKYYTPERRTVVVLKGEHK
jgi:zinc protease